MVFISIFALSCNSTKALQSGNWEYINENGETKTLIIDNNRWISDYCFLPFEDSKIWNCIEINTRIKIIEKNKIRLIFDQSRPRESLTFDIIELTAKKLVLQKHNFFVKPYEVEYLRKN